MILPVPTMWPLPDLYLMFLPQSSLLSFIISVSVCLCMYVLVIFVLFWIAVWPFLGRNCPFGFLFVVF